MQMNSQIYNAILYFLITVEVNSPFKLELERITEQGIQLIGRTYLTESLILSLIYIEC